MGVKVERSAADGVVVVSLVGDHDLATAPRVREALTNEMLGDARAIVVELRECTFIDSAVIGLLVTGARRARERGLAFVTLNASPTVERSLRLIGVTEAVGLGQSFDRIFVDAEDGADRL